MSVGVLALALGIAAAPPLGASLAEVWAGLGAKARFGPGCPDGAGRPVVEVAAVYRGAPTWLRAEFGRDWRVASLHVVEPDARAADAAACGARLARRAGVRAGARWDGPLLWFSATAPAVAGVPARWRALWRASRGECRVMLTIGPEETRA